VTRTPRGVMEWLAKGFKDGALEEVEGPRFERLAACSAGIVSRRQTLQQYCACASHVVAQAGESVKPDLWR
jgi:hypothetical protein